VGSSGCWQRQPAASAASCTPPPPAGCPRERDNGRAGRARIAHRPATTWGQGHGLPPTAVHAGGRAALVTWPPASIAANARHPRPPPHRFPPPCTRLQGAGSYYSSTTGGVIPACSQMFSFQW
jgi:hypothetical protein